MKCPEKLKVLQIDFSSFHLVHFLKDALIRQVEILKFYFRSFDDFFSLQLILQQNKQFRLSFNTEFFLNARHPLNYHLCKNLVKRQYFTCERMQIDIAFVFLLKPLEKQLHLFLFQHVIKLLLPKFILEKATLECSPVDIVLIKRKHAKSVN